jgi:hypothetical protein
VPEPLVNEADVLDYLGDASADVLSRIPAAEAMVAAYIGAKTLHEREVVARLRIPYDVEPDEPVEVRNGPIALVTALNLGGTDVELDSTGADPDNNLTVDPWSFRWFEGISANSECTLTYLAGYTCQTIPEQIKEAIILTAAMIHTDPDTTKISERIGDYAVTFSERNETEELNGRICLALKQYKRAHV